MNGGKTHPAPARKSVLVLSSTFPRWKDDAEPPFVLELCRRLQQSFDVTVLAPRAPRAVMREKMEGVEVVRFRYFIQQWESLAYRGGILARLKHNPLRFGLVPFFFFAETHAVVKLLRLRRFDCIHAHWLIPQGLAALLALIQIERPPPLLVTSHGGDLFGLSGPVGNWCNYRVAAAAQVVTVVSRSMHYRLSKMGVDNRKIRIIPMGVDLENRFMPPQNRPERAHILFVGRLVEKKGLRYLIDALPRIRARHPAAILTVVGDGPEKKALVRQAAERGVGGCVKFVGSVANTVLPGYYRDADVVVFPSIIGADGDREGFGLVLVEALGCGCAAVVSDLPAMQDIVADGKTALVVPQKSARHLAEAVSRLLDEPDVRRSLGAAGRRHVLGKFGWDIIAAQYADLIENLSGKA